MRVLGVDPGLSRCGVGVVDGAGHRPSVAQVGVIRTPAQEPTAMRLADLHEELAGLVASLRPDAVAVERVFFTVNARTAMSVGQAAGIALLCAARAGIPVVEYTPTQIKAEVTGQGNADKQQVAFMVRALLGLAELPGPPDAADALALALCHLRRAGLQHRRQTLSQASDGRGRAADAGMSPRLAAAVEQARPGAQVVQQGRTRT